MRIVAVVLNFRRADDTIACVRSLRATAPGVQPLVVDNGSNDGSADRIEAALPDVALIRSEQNSGYAGGNNLGIAAALAGERADAVLILNNDLTLEPGAVDALSRALADRPSWGVAAPLSLLSGAGDVVDFFAGRVFLEHAALRAEGRDEPRGDRFRHPVETEYVTGSALLVRREVFERAGRFDERFFLLWEDVDFSLRARAAGFALGVEPDAVVRHARSASFGHEASALQRYFFVRNPYLLMRKHLAPPVRWMAEARATRRYLAWARKGDDASVRRAIAAGLRDGIAGRFGPPPRWLLP